MTRSLVTGVAGFIGSHLAERLIREGHEVVGIDCFTDYYARSIKEENIKGLLGAKGFHFKSADLREVDLNLLLAGVDYVFHLAAQAGVRSSWGKGFEAYVSNNVLATQRLLEASVTSTIKKFVYASSSSVYGASEQLPLKEYGALKPVSPYGVTKLAGEFLCYSYWKNFDLPIISLRYFTVYGPRQRPDMAFYRFFSSLIQGADLEVYGNGEQTRDFTFVSDVVEANILSIKSGESGKVFNIAGGSRVSLNRVLALIQDITGRKVRIKHLGEKKGDVRDTLADTSEAHKYLVYTPQVDLVTGLKEQWRWMQLVAPNLFER